MKVTGPGAITCHIIHNRQHFFSKFKFNLNLQRRLHTMYFTCSFCCRNFHSQGGLTKHMNVKHNKNSAHQGMVKEAKLHTFICHRHLSGMSRLVFNCCMSTEYLLAHPCAPDGMFLRSLVSQCLTSNLSNSYGNPWLPFQDRLEFEWAHYHYMQLQSSASGIQHSLDLWRAAVRSHQTDNNKHDGVPWKNAKEMYDMIDLIPKGSVGWMTHPLSYCGPRPTRTVPRWMQEIYELNVRNVLPLFEEQLASNEFDGQFKYTPYKEYDKNGSCVYTSLMSGDWADRQVVCASVFYVY
jgi:hypothetical protein